MGPSTLYFTKKESGTVHQQVSSRIFGTIQLPILFSIDRLYKEFGSQGIAGYTEFMKANPNFEILELVCQENSIVQEAAKRQRYQMSRI